MGIQASAFGKILLVDPFLPRFSADLQQAAAEVEASGEPKTVRLRGIAVTLTRVTDAEIKERMPEYRRGLKFVRALI